MTFNELVQEYKNLILDDPFDSTDMGEHQKDHEVSDLAVSVRYTTYA